MNSLSPEDLKIIAEGMGYEVMLSELGEACTIKGELAVRKPHQSRHYTYTPDITNDTQCMEIMEKLRVELTPVEGGWITRIYEGLGFPVAEGGGKTINEAVCNTALKYFKEQAD